MNNGKYIKAMNKTALKLVVFCLAILIVLPVNAVERVRYIHTDIVGSPLAATDESGEVLVWREYYRPYGERIIDQAGDDRLWFTGKLEQSKIGLNYYGARWYDPMAGRFAGVDPIGVNSEDFHTFNRYCYANNNPYRFKDPNGKWAEDAVLASISLSLGAYNFSQNVNQGKYLSAAVDVLGMAGDTIAAALPVVPGVLGMTITASRNAAKVTKATDLPVIKPGSQEWINAVNDLSGLGKGKLNLRTETATDAKSLLREARGNMDRRKNYTNQNYKKGYETHNVQNSREMGAGNDLQQLKWKDGKSGGHIYYDRAN